MTQFGTRQIAEALGVTRKQVGWWAYRGYLGEEWANVGSGNHREGKVDMLVRAQVLIALLKLGWHHKHAARMIANLPPQLTDGMVTWQWSDGAVTVSVRQALATV